MFVGGEAQEVYSVQTSSPHSSLQVTMDRYGHLFPSDDHKAAMDAIAGELMK